MLFKVGPPLDRFDEVDFNSKNWTLDVDEVAWFLSEVIIENHNRIIFDDSLYNPHCKRSELHRLSVQRVPLPLVFARLPESFAKAANIFRFQPQQAGVTGLVEVRKVVMRSGLQLAWIKCYGNQLLVVKQHVSKQKRTIHVESILKNKIIIKDVPDECWSWGGGPGE